MLFRNQYLWYTTRSANSFKQKERRYEHETYQKLKYKKIAKYSQKRRLRRMPDILPVGLQDFLYSRKPDLRETQIAG